MLLVGLVTAVACGGIAALIWRNPVPNSFESREEAPAYVPYVTRTIAVCFGLAGLGVAVVSL